VQDAINAYSECLSVDRSLRSLNAKLYNNRASAYSKLRKHREAVKDASEAIALDPNYLKAYRRRAEASYNLGEVEDLEQALRDYEKLAELSPDEEQRDLRQKVHQVSQHVPRVMNSIVGWHAIAAMCICPESIAG
jgi:DnaJ family protein C protein 7